ncbi:hypothetical protein D043_3982A, partial [Vibrio parahaemolyticus EKP-021]
MGKVPPHITVIININRLTVNY